MKNSWIVAIICAACVLLNTLHAVNQSPWLSPSFILESKTEYLFQTYGSVQTKQGNKKYSADDSFFTQSFTLSALNMIGLELDTTFSQTARHTFALDNIQLTGKYLWLDDIGGDDFLTLTTGLTISQIFGLARRDISSFHHKGIGFEFDVAAGKEWDCKEFWRTRIWGVMGYGVADQGSPWLRADMQWEKNCLNTHAYKVFLASLWGFGGNKLSLEKEFDGYGSINHQSIDVGLGYEYSFDTIKSISMSYAHRIFAKNGPKNVNMFYFTFQYNFSPNVLGPVLPKISIQ